MKNIKTVLVDYIESGTFVGGEENAFVSGIKIGEQCVVLKEEDYELLLIAAKFAKKAKKVLKNIVDQDESIDLETGNQVRNLAYGKEYKKI
jgi:hypothetical protein